MKNNEIIISQVQLVVDSFVNEGDAGYDYLKNLLSLFLASNLKKIPFFTVTEAQKNQLISAISLNVYLMGFTGKYLYDTPTVFVKPKLKVVVYRGEDNSLPFAIRFYGSYRVENGIVFIKIFRSSRYVNFEKKVYLLKVTIDDLIQNSEHVFTQFVKSILHYRVFVTTIKAEPEDSIISIDDKVYGIGNVQNILLTAGSHRLHIHRDGYNDYYDVITVLRDGFTKSIILRKLNNRKAIEIDSNPAGASVYVNEKFIGKTPILLKIFSSKDVITIEKEGYISRTIYPYEYGDKTRMKIKLRILSEVERIKLSAERYKKQSKLLYYSGIGFAAATIIMASKSTLYKQKATLYKNLDYTRYENALDKKKLYSTIATVTAFSSVVAFTFSFNDILKYFKTYETGD